MQRTKANKFLCRMVHTLLFTCSWHIPLALPLAVLNYCYFPTFALALTVLFSQAPLPPPTNLGNSYSSLESGSKASSYCEVSLILPGGLQVLFPHVCCSCHLPPLSYGESLFTHPPFNYRLLDSKGLEYSLSL